MEMVAHFGIMCITKNENGTEAFSAQNENT